MQTKRDDSIHPYVEKVAYGNEGQWVQDEIHEGLTKREYFANSAPDVIPDWFKHSFKGKPKQPITYIRKFGRGSNHQYKELLAANYDEDEEVWADGAVVPDSLRTELKIWGEEWKQFWLDEATWEKNNQTQRYFQWRIFYAEALIDSLNSELSSHGLLPK